MRLFTTITLFLLAALSVTLSVFLAVDGNLARVTGWYRFEPGMPLFSRENTERLADVCWMRIEDLHDRIECSRDEYGNWWIEKPFKDRMAPNAARAILSFTAQARMVDTLPLNNITRSNMRDFGVETSPHRITLKVQDGEDKTTIARYTLGSTSPWLADAGNGTDLLPTTYLRTDFYGRDKRIHVVSGNILDLFKDGLEALRDPHPLQFDPEQLEALSISRGDAETGEPPLQISRISAESPWSIDSPVLTAADDDKVNTLVRALSNLTALRVEEAADVTLPDTPACRLQLTIAGRQEELCLYPAFEEQDNSVCYATVSSRNVVFVLPAERRVKRTGCYAALINAVCKMPVLPERAMAQVHANGNIIYTAELAMELADLRSDHFSELDAKDIARVSLRDTRTQAAIRLLLIPGNAEGDVEDIWMYAPQDAPYRKAESPAVQRLLNGMRNIPVEAVVADARPGDPLPLEKFGLNNPDLMLSVLPRPCVVRANLFGLDLPLVKDRKPRMFLLRRYPDPETGKNKWFGAEMGGASVCRLSTKFTRLLSLRPEKWKQREMLEFPFSAVRRLTLQFREAPMVLDYDYQEESWSGKLGEEDVTPRINPHRAESYIRRLQKMKVGQWLEDNDADALDALRRPAFGVKLDLEITDYSDVEQVTIEETQDERAHADNPEDLLDGGEAQEDDLDAKMREMAFGERAVRHETRTLQIAPSSQDSDTPFFYGRIVETGELFILPFEDAQGLAGDILDM